MAQWLNAFAFGNKWSNTLIIYSIVISFCAAVDILLFNQIFSRSVYYGANYFVDLFQLFYQY